MESIPISKSDIPKPESENTAVDFDKEIQESRFQYVLSRISEQELEGQTCFVYGMGGHQKSSYKSISEIDGAVVCWSDSLMHWLLSPLRFIVASYQGIVKVKRDLLPNIFEKLVNRSMAGVYIFRENLTDEFINQVKLHKYYKPVNQWLMDMDDGYFIYIVDADNYESTSGMYEIVSIGINCPKKLSSIITLN